MFALVCDCVGKCLYGIIYGIETIHDVISFILEHPVFQFLFQLLCLWESLSRLW